MEYRHEIINFGDRVPVRCFVHQLGQSGRHWHQSLELLFVMSGSVSIIVDGERFFLERDDVILINSNSPHELAAESCILAAVQIKLSLFDEKLMPEGPIYFDCNSKTSANREGLRQIKRIVALFVKAYASNSESRVYRAKSLSYALLSELMTNFRVDRSRSQQMQAQQQNERIARIVDYIEAHHWENITLQGLAEREFLSVSYLSRFFNKMMGMGFSAYLNQVRLTHAVSDLLSSDATIDRIAGDNGFPNTQAFVQLFKKQYGLLPSQYRRQKLAEGSDARPVSSTEYTILDTTQYLQYFAAYLDEGPGEVYEEHALPDITTRCVADALGEAVPLRHTWRSFTAVGSARELLQADVQARLTRLQREVGFTYVKFHGILSDDMHVLARDRAGRLTYSFAYVYKALDFLQTIGLKPLIQLSFMPAAIAQNPERRIFGSTMINSLPVDMNTWRALVRALVKHLLARYGEDTVAQWPFTVWNEPDTPVSMFGFGDDAVFYRFYQATWNAVREVSPRVKIGSPSSYFDIDENSVWMARFGKWCAANGCPPDFILFHYYGTVLYQNRGTYNETGVTLGQLQLTRDENLMARSIDGMLACVRGLYKGGMPIYITEWNFSPSHRELLGDTCFRSCYLVKNILENYDRLEGMGYWMLTDMLEEYQVPGDTFHGGLGLFTHNGIPKPAYYAMWLLAKLGDECVSRGDGWFLTRRGGSYQLMLYHYRHYSDLYAKCEAFDVTPENRYTPFGEEQRREYELRIVHAPEGEWQAAEYSVSRASGSAFDKWVEMGAQPLETPEEEALLASLSRPMLTKYRLHASAEGLTVNAILDTLEVRLILLTRING